MYLLVNNIYNHDTILFTPNGFGEGIGTGRWLLEILGRMMSLLEMDSSIPLYKNSIAVIYLAVSSVVISKILGTKNKYVNIAIGAITIVFPSIAGIMMHSYSSPYNTFAFLLMSVGVYFVIKNKITYFIVGIIMLACSLGIYQAYLPFAVTLYLLYMLRMCLEENDWYNTIKVGVKFAISLILAYIVYIVCLNFSLSLFDTTLRSYKGVDEMGKINFDTLPNQIITCYKNVIKLPFRRYAGISSSIIIRLCYMATYIMIAVNLIDIIIKTKREKKTIVNMALFFCIIAILPIAISFMNIMVIDADEIHTLMVSSFVAIFYLLFILIDGKLPAKIELDNINNKNKVGTAIVFQLIIYIAVINFSYQANGNFRKLHYLDQQSENYYTVMLARIIEAEGYHNNSDIVFVGRNIADPNPRNNWDGTIFDNTGREYDFEVSTFARKEFIENLFGYRTKEINKESELYSQYKSEIELLLLYPNAGSIDVIDDIVFVRFE